LFSSGGDQGAGIATDEGYAIGGTIPKTGWYYVHENEAVISPDAIMTGYAGQGKGDYPRLGGSGQQMINLANYINLDGENIATILTRRQIQAQRTNSTYR
jgi:hypothetical protein